MTPKRRADLISGLILVVGIAGMFAAIWLGDPLVVTREGCVELWNATPSGPEDPPPAFELRLFAEGEQDLGYGLCRLEWAMEEGKCRSLGTPVWKDTTTWNRQPSTPCTPTTGGAAVELFGDGRLRLVDDDL